MKIWHEELISLLCNKHLKLMWRDGMYMYNHKEQCTIEFVGCPLHLVYTLNCIYEEADKRGIKLPKPPTPFDITDEPITQLMKELRVYIPSESKQYQFQQLEKKECCTKLWQL